MCSEQYTFQLSANLYDILRVPGFEGADVRVISARYVQDQ